MKEKIKKIFGFIGHAWSGGPRGKLGIVFAVFAMFMFIRMFLGDMNIQRFIVNAWNLNHERTEWAQLTKVRDTLEYHIELLKNGSPDYVEELGLQYLNIGDPKFRILKI
jgi:cell division protein FtsB